MNQQTVFVIIFLAMFLVLIAITQWLYFFFKIPAEQSRKFLHVSGGILSLCCPLFFQSHWWVFALCASAFALLLLSYLKHWLPSIHQTTRHSIGSVIFPIPVYICFVVARELGNELFFYIPISFLTISDTVAEWSGKRWGALAPKLVYNQKTMAGSLGFAICSIVIAVVWGLVFNLAIEHILLISISISLVAMVTELVSTKGLDNITVPIVTLLCLVLLRQLIPK